MHQRELVLRGDARQPCGRFRIDGPGGGAVVFGTVDVVIRRAIDDGGVLLPIPFWWVGDIEVGVGTQFSIGKQAFERPPQLPVRAGDEDAPGGHRAHVFKSGVLLVLLRNLGGLQRPVHDVEVHRGVASFGRPVLIHQVAVGGFLQSLKAIGDAPWDKHRSLRPYLVGDDLAKAI